MLKKKKLSSRHDRSRTFRNYQHRWLHTHDIQKTKLANIPECRRLCYKIPPLRFHRRATSAKRGTVNFLQGQDTICTNLVLVVSPTYIQVIPAGLRRSPCVCGVCEGRRHELHSSWCRYTKRSYGCAD